MKYGNLKMFKCDQKDLKLLNGYKTYIHVSGTKKYLKCYKRIEGKAFFILFHHLILAKKEGFEIDHKNGNGLDNRRKNLRYVTRAENNHNRIGVKGFYFDSWSGKWKAEIWINKRKHSLGRFKTESLARAAYVKAKRNNGLFSFKLCE